MQYDSAIRTVYRSTLICTGHCSVSARAPISNYCKRGAVCRIRIEPLSHATPQATPAPSSSPATLDLNNLTPEQRQALNLAIIKTSQKPVGNITVVPFQNNFNYGLGPYARFQYNLNIQPVFPIMLSSSWNLISRDDHPAHQPTFARVAGGLCDAASRLPVDVRFRRYATAIFLRAENQTGPNYLGRRAHFSTSNRSAEQ